MRKRLVTSLIIIFSFYLIVSLSREIIELIQKEQVIEQEQLKLEELMVETQLLKEELNYVQSEEFVEKEARGKLGLSKEGETIVVLPENFEEMVESSRKGIGVEKIPNWRKWLRIFGL